MTSSSRQRSKSAGQSRAKVRTSAVKVKCSFCGNTFYAAPREAVCPKCSRPANRELPLLWRALSLFLPPLGFVYALVIRAHSPVAGLQGLICSAVGALIYGALFIAHSQLHLF
ncbi:hypothetical protein B1R32_11288 [Abditibacterium utsteinense]|uniref:Uncharacterized protein n=1 Tax=Abditibacterium utsteinense TaxID=1960156 RepID=A0A2S8SRJ9_9BACT|nr:hypothetical protein [Abditibacterium utsteinense]PQV63433.1 hypothetical protein B1R32_11288 [Abditibacterium utsteinense]